MFRERHWDETEEQYESNLEYRNLIESKKTADRIYNIGGVAGVPEDILDQVYPDFI